MSDTDTAVVGHGLAKCEKPERYIQQLVSHWGHKMATTYDEGANGLGGMGTFPFSDLTSAVMTARPDGIAITLTTADREENERMRGVIERHIDRFAFREAPLSYEWTD